MQAVLSRFRALHPSRRAVVLILTAVICFSVLETTGKYLSQYYPVIEVVWARYTVHALLMLMLLAPRLGWTMVRTAQPVGQVLRAALLMGSTLCNFAALSFLPLPEVRAMGLFPLTGTAGAAGHFPLIRRRRSNPARHCRRSNSKLLWRRCWAGVRPPGPEKRGPTARSSDRADRARRLGGVTAP
jgi:hypothetical protein